MICPRCGNALATPSTPCACATDAPEAPSTGDGPPAPRADAPATAPAAVATEAQTEGAPESEDATASGADEPSEADVPDAEASDEPPVKKRKKKRRKRAPEAFEAIRPDAARVEAQRLLETRWSLDQVIETLEHRGLGAYQAERAAREAWGDLAVAKARKTGFLWAAGGLVVTLGTCAMADGGGRYLLAYGPILWGIWRVATAENVRRQVGGE